MGKKGLKFLLLMLLVFACAHTVLVGTYRAGTLSTIIMALSLLALGIVFFVKSVSIPQERKRNYYGIFSGLFFWAALGEALGHLGLIEIAEWRMFPLLTFFTFLAIFFGVKGYLPKGIMFSLGHFTAIWFLHAIMINEYNLMGRTSWITYPSAGIFALLSIFFCYSMTKSKTDTENMAYALALFLVAWSVLEYFGGWGLVPEPWMLLK